MTVFAGVVRSELSKLLSVRSTYWTLGAALVFNVGLAALLAIFLPDQLSAADRADLEPARISLGGIHLAQVAFGILGVLVITSEYATGLIRTSVSAVPDRRLLLAAKGASFAMVALAAGAVACFAAYFAFQVALSDTSLRSSLTDPGVLSALVGGGLFLVLLGLLGLGVGAVVRSSAAAVAVLMGVLFVPPILLELLPGTWNDAVGAYVPMRAGSQVFALHEEAGALSPWAGMGVFALYTATALGLALFLIDRRDA